MPAAYSEQYREVFLVWSATRVVAQLQSMQVRQSDPGMRVTRTVLPRLSAITCMRLLFADLSHVVDKPYPCLVSLTKTLRTLFIHPLDLCLLRGHRN